MSNLQFILSTYAEKERKRRRAVFFRRWRNRIVAAFAILLLVGIVVYSLWGTA